MMVLRGVFSGSMFILWGVWIISFKDPCYLRLVVIVQPVEELQGSPFPRENPNHQFLAALHLETSSELENWRHIHCYLRWSVDISFKHVSFELKILTLTSICLFELKLKGSNSELMTTLSLTKKYNSTPAKQITSTMQCELQTAPIQGFKFICSTILLLFSFESFTANTCEKSWKPGFLINLKCILNNLVNLVISLHK